MFPSHFYLIIQNYMDIVYKALSDKNRREILTLLKRQDMSVTEIQQYFDITPASLSHHLNMLKQANLVIAERKGQFIYYSLNMSVFEESLKMIMKLFNT